MFRRLLTLALNALLCRGFRLPVGIFSGFPCLRRRYYLRPPESWHANVGISGGALDGSSESKFAEFKGNIIVVDDSNIDQHAFPLSTVLTSSCVGFDLEYVPDYYSSIHRNNSDRTRPAVVQIASSNTCIVYLLYKIGYLPNNVSLLLSGCDILKISHGAPSDMRLLYRHFGVLSHNFVDLQDVCENLKLRPCSLKSVVDRVLGLRLSKKHQCSNWEAPSLSADQVRYAATDAWVTLECYLRLQPRGIRKLFVNECGDVQVENCD